jgi:hypothetical protein
LIGTQSLAQIEIRKLFKLSAFSLDPSAAGYFCTLETTDGKNSSNILWLESFNIPNLVHETHHATYDVIKVAGILDDRDEAAAYYQGYLFNEIVTKAQQRGLKCVWK